MLRRHCVHIDTFKVISSFIWGGGGGGGRCGENARLSRKERNIGWKLFPELMVHMEHNL